VIGPGLLVLGAGALAGAAVAPPGSRWRPLLALAAAPLALLHPALPFAMAALVAAGILAGLPGPEEASGLEALLAAGARRGEVLAIHFRAALRTRGLLPLLVVAAAAGAEVLFGAPPAACVTGLVLGLAAGLGLSALRLSRRLQGHRLRGGGIPVHPGFAPPPARPGPPPEVYETRPAPGAEGGFARIDEL
jgi:hypothetical protein